MKKNCILFAGERKGRIFTPVITTTNTTKMKVTKEQAGVYNVKGNNEYTIAKLEGINTWVIHTAKKYDACTCENNWGISAATKKEAVLWIAEEDAK